MSANPSPASNKSPDYRIALAPAGVLAFYPDKVDSIAAGDR